MTNKITILLLTIYLVISCGQRKVETQLTESELTELKRKIEGVGLQTALSEMESTDQNEIENYKLKLKSVIDLMPTTWTSDSSKLTIESYIKKGRLGDNYLRHSYNSGQIKTTTEVPRHIKDSFDKKYMCYSADYWKQFNVEQSVGFIWDTLGTKTMIEIIKTR